MKDSFGISKVPGFAIVDDATNQKFVKLEGFSTEELTTWLQDLVDGKVTPHYKSAEVPAEAYDEESLVIVGKNWQKEVMDVDKSVFLFFYAPWCGHCKSAKPDWAKFAGEFKTSEDLVVAKMDATENDPPHPAVKIQGFPTFY